MYKVPGRDYGEIFTFYGTPKPKSEEYPNRGNVEGFQNVPNSYGTPNSYGYLNYYENKSQTIDLEAFLDKTVTNCSTIN